MNPFELNVPPIHFPLLGNSVVIGVFSLLHIALAALTVGFMVLAPALEWRGRDTSFYTDLAHSLTRFTILVFSVSTVLAVIMVELMIGLFPVTTMWMWNQFRAPIGIAIAAFICQLFALYPYYHYWDALRTASIRLHILLGTIAAGFMMVWVLVLDGMGSYMLTPVGMTGIWANLLNPTWIPLSLHRLVGDMIIAGYVMAAYGAWRLGRATDLRDRPYYIFVFQAGWAIGLSSLLAQPFTGLLYALIIQHAAPEAYHQLIDGRYRLLLYVQFGLIGLMFLGNHVLLRSSTGVIRSRGTDLAMLIGVLCLVASVGYPVLRRGFLYLLVGLTIRSIVLGRRQGWLTADPASPRLRPVAISLGALSLLVYLTMGTIRETVRHPDTVRGYISLQDDMRDRTLVNEAAR